MDDLGCTGWIVMIVVLIVVLWIQFAIINSDLPDIWKWFLLK